MWLWNVQFILKEKKISVFSSLNRENTDADDYFVSVHVNVELINQQLVVCSDSGQLLSHTNVLYPSVKHSHFLLDFIY